MDRGTKTSGPTERHLDFMFQLLLTTCSLHDFRDAILQEAKAELDNVLGKPEVFQGCFIPPDDKSIKAWANCLESRLQCTVEVNPTLHAVKVWSAGSGFSEEVKYILSALFSGRPVLHIKLSSYEPTTEMKHVAYKHNLRLQVHRGKKHSKVLAWPTPVALPDAHLSGPNFCQNMAAARADILAALNYEVTWEDMFEWELVEEKDSCDSAALDAQAQGESSLHGRRLGRKVALHGTYLHCIENWPKKKVAWEKRRLEGTFPGIHLAETRAELALRPATRAQIRRKKAKGFAVERIGSRILKERQCSGSVGEETDL